MSNIQNKGVPETKNTVSKNQNYQRNKSKIFFRKEGHVFPH